MNAIMYRDECVIAHLVPFLKGIGLSRVLFWPDMATSHYANIVNNALTELKIDFVGKKVERP